MSSVDTFEPCPQCGADAHSSFQTRTGDVELYCLRCGYRGGQFLRRSPSPGFRNTRAAWRWRGHGDVLPVSHFEPGGDAYVRQRRSGGWCGRSYGCRRSSGPELLQGTLDSTHDLSAEEVQLLNDALAAFGERLAAIEHTELFTGHVSEPGYRRFVCWRTDQRLEISRFGDVWPFLTIRDGVADLSPSAAQEVLLG